MASCLPSSFPLVPLGRFRFDGVVFYALAFFPRTALFALLLRIMCRSFISRSLLFYAERIGTFRALLLFLRWLGWYTRRWQGGYLWSGWMEKLFLGLCVVRDDVLLT